MTDAPDSVAPQAEVDPKIEADRQMIVDARGKGAGATLWAYTRLSGPGWLQSAITLGGGSLAGSLYLGVIGGYEMLWLQPIMMILGVIMLSAIGYVTLSTETGPFREINRHVNPVLGWGWLIAAMMANLVWAMPQFSLGTAALEQNLAPGTFGGPNGKYFAAAMLFVIGTVIVWFYDSGGWGVKVFEVLLKIMVAVVVISFFGVVIAMTANGELPWGEIAAGFIPNFNLLNEPASGLKPFIEASGLPDYWTDAVLSSQRDRMVTAAATAVGINMTFLLPYSMLKRGWNSDFRGLATFDLSTGLFIPFVLATSCVMIASAQQFHGQYDPVLVGEATAAQQLEKEYTDNWGAEGYAALTAEERESLINDRDALATGLKGAYEKNLDGRIKAEVGPEAFDALSDEEKQTRRAELPAADKQVAAMLVSRDAFQLANSLERLTGRTVSQYVFGIGVLGMAISTIIILMLINGFTFCEMLGVPSEGMMHRVGAILPGVTGAAGFLFLWGDSEARFWLAVPTSVFGMVLLPIAYITFFFLMNSKSLLGDNLPTGGKRIALNIAMLVALVAASIGAGWSIWSKLEMIGVYIVAGFLGLALLVHFISPPKGNADLDTEEALND